MGNQTPGTARWRFSPAMAVALLALFVALGGSGYAAVKINGKHIANRSIAGKKLKRNTVTGKEVKEWSLRRNDFQPGQLEAGFTKVVMRKGAPIDIESSEFGRAEAHCETGEVATGGGVYNESQVYAMTVTSSYPLPNPIAPPAVGDGVPATGWRVWVANNSTSVHPVEAYVLCASH